MKIKHIICIVLFASAAAFTACKGDYAVKVDGDTLLTMDDFNRYYYLMNKSLFNEEKNEEIDRLAQDPSLLESRIPNPQMLDMARAALDKEVFLERYISQKLVYDKAMKDDTVDRKELDALVEMAKIDAVNKYYLGKKLKSQIRISDAEVEEAYKECKSIPQCNAQIAGRTSSQISQAIKGNLEQKKMEMQAGKFVRDIIQEKKIDREGFKKAMAKLNTTKAPEKKSKK